MKIYDLLFENEEFKTGKEKAEEKFKSLFKGFKVKRMDAVNVTFKSLKQFF